MLVSWQQIQHIHRKTEVRWRVCFYLKCMRINFVYGCYKLVCYTYACVFNTCVKNNVQSAFSHASYIYTHIPALPTLKRLCTPLVKLKNSIASWSFRITLCHPSSSFEITLGSEHAHLNGLYWCICSLSSECRDSLHCIVRCCIVYYKSNNLQSWTKQLAVESKKLPKICAENWNQKSNGNQRDSH